MESKTARLEPGGCSERVRKVAFMLPPWYQLYILPLLPSCRCGYWGQEVLQQRVGTNAGKMMDGTFLFSACGSIQNSD
jgi:hypothetical protein